MMFSSFLMFCSTICASPLTSQTLPSTAPPTTISTKTTPLTTSASLANSIATSHPPTTSTATSSLLRNKSSTPPVPKIKNMTTPDDGWQYGNVIIHNWCNETLYVQSVGAHYLGGPRNGATTGWGTPEDSVYHSISTGTSFTEPFRASGGCAYKGTPPYCPLEDKLAGQAISLKISKTNNPADTNITQLEYALYRNPATGDAFKRLYYDVSLLDCANPNVMDVTGEGEGGVGAVGGITDFNATPDMHDKKLALCPGYEGGVSVTFSGDEKGAVCPPIYCDGVEKCFMIYTVDRTRPQESSFTCEKEYRGDLRLDLCAEKGDEVVKGAKEEFGNWALTATHEVLQLQLERTATEGGGPTGRASATKGAGSLQTGRSSVVEGTESGSFVGVSNSVPGMGVSSSTLVATPSPSIVGVSNSVLVGARSQSTASVKA